MPETASEIQAQIGAVPDGLTYEAAGKWGLLPSDAVITKGKALFPRIDVKKEIEELNRLNPAETKAAKPEGTAQITIQDFSKIDLRAAKVTACEPVKHSKKLLKLTLDDGAGGRTVASGISQWYRPEDLIGRTVVLVSNLKPAKLCGVESQGMILAADAGENDVKIVFADGVPAGSKIR